MREVTDQTGRTIRVTDRPQRIVSLVPSQTELLFDLGLEEEVAGLTLFCIHPEEKVIGKERIGGTKKLDLEKIRSLKPDLIIGNKEENERDQVLALADEFPVWVSDIGNLPEALDMIERVGELVNRTEKAAAMKESIKNKFDRIPKASALKTLYLIWRKPYMSIGADTFIHHQLDRCGLINICGNALRYPVLDADEVERLSPELILLSSEPYPFQEKHIQELRALVPAAEILLVDGEMFSWYGSRLLKAADYLGEFTERLNFGKSKRESADASIV